jgi:DNA polymerase I
MAESVLEFYPIDIGYTTEENRTIVKVYGITEEGKRVILEDYDFCPYFYVQMKNPKRAQEIIRNMAVDEFKVTEAKIVKKKFMGNQLNVIKVSVNNFSGISKIAKKCKEMAGYLKSFEKDISIPKRYILEKELKFFTRMRAAGILETDKEILVLKTKSLESINGDLVEDIKFMAFDIETYNKDGYSSPEKDPIIMISIYTGDGKTKILTTKKINKPFVERLPGEMELIKKFVETVNDEKPDIIVGYNTDLFDFPYIKERARKYGIRLSMGWQREEMISARSGRNFSAKFRGLVHIDLYPFVMNILGPTLKTEVYGLDSVSQEVLGTGKADIDKDKMWEMWENGGKDLEKLAEYSAKDAEITGKLAEKFIYQMIELSRLVGLPIFDICRTGYSQYVEFYMMRNSCRFNELTPNKPSKAEVEKRFRRTYIGAFVYEPVPGLYDNIVVLDFRSLYPSIIIKHNVSPETLNKGKDHVSPEIDGKPVCSFPKTPLGFFPTVLKNVLERRWTIKSVLKNMKKSDKDYKILEARQYALKTVANAAYGYLGFPAARWYSLECAECITSWGRQYIKSLIKDAEDQGFKVLYGDTDSVFFTVKKKDDYMKFLKEQNKKMVSPMEIEFGNFYPTGIFVSKKTEKKGAKKKYALLNDAGEIEIKGFEYVRRDWSEIARECQKNVIDVLLKEKNYEKAAGIVKDVIKKLRKNEVSMEKTIIHTTLKKTLSEYKSVGPHVAAAKKASEKGRKIGPGTMLRYIITAGKGSISDRAVLYEDAKKHGIRYDPDYYINNQIIPAVEQILDVGGLESKEERLEKYFGG